MNPHDENPLDDSHSTNITSGEIDVEMANKLRGDAIGDTMYSEVFVLKTLMQFSELNWSTEVEEELCFLWDMTEEKDVSEYLFQASYPSLACTAIMKYDEPRFVEIVIGIFANLLCSKCENKQISVEEIRIVLNVLNSDDPLILVQVMRFLHAVSFMFEKLDSLMVSQEIFDRIIFILFNSTNKDLVLHSLKAVAAMTVDQKLDRNSITEDLFKASIVGYQLVKSQSDEKGYHVATKYFIEISCNICSYIDNANLNHILDSFSSQIDVFLNQIVDLFNYFTCEDNLLPVPEELKYYSEALVYVFRVVELKYNSKIFVNLCKILIVLVDNLEEFDLFAELLCYFISVGSVAELESDIGAVSKSKMKHVLLGIEQNKDLKFDFEYFNNLQNLLKVI